MTCALCGCPTSRRLCRQCELADKHDGVVGGEAHDDGDDDPEPRTDGGRDLPEDFEQFVDEDQDDLPCRECGDRVDRERLVDRRCPGCRHGHGPAMTDGGEERDHIYIGRTPGMVRWGTDYGEIAEWAGGEENVTIAHARGHEYVLDLSDVAAENEEACLNQRYDCGHVAYGPPVRLPAKCPECHPIATDGGATTRVERGKSWTDLTGYQRDCLLVIAELSSLPVDSYGLEIKGRLEDYYGEEVNHGRLYPNLDILVEEGLVAKGDIDARTHSYELTDHGHEIVAAYADYVDVRRRMADRGRGERPAAERDLLVLVDAMDHGDYPGAQLGDLIGGIAHDDDAMRLSVALRTLGQLINDGQLVKPTPDTVRVAADVEVTGDE